MRRGLVLGVPALLVLVGACSEPPRVPAAKAGITAVALNTFEVRDDDIDRFQHCPPAGDIGQDWVPPIPEWHAPAASASAAVPESAVEAETGDPGAGAAQPGEDPMAPAPLGVLTDAAENQTRASFRRCYHHGLLFDPTQDGHVALVLRVDRTGHVASVETWGACDLSPEAILCMRDEAKHVKLRPPAGGSATITVPAVFTNGAEKQREPNDGYAASAYVAVESMRPRLHHCEETAKYAHADLFASAVMTVDVDAKGKGTHVGVDQWKGGHELLGCAAEVLRDAPFGPPPAGRGKIVVPIVFNPRPGTE
ncbi:MAG TPA: hypothetical protein VIY73_15580 [Polyangiaceae bacterium]